MDRTSDLGSDDRDSNSLGVTIMKPKCLEDSELEAKKILSRDYILKKKKVYYLYQKGLGYVKTPLSIMLEKS